VITYEYWANGVREAAHVAIAETLDKIPRNERDEDTGARVAEDIRDRRLNEDVDSLVPVYNNDIINLACDHHYFFLATARLNLSCDSITPLSAITYNIYEEAVFIYEEVLNEFEKDWE
jgi:hypothetical protein